MVVVGVLKHMDQLMNAVINYYGVKRKIINVRVSYKNVNGVDKKFRN
jgi:hypothetical protein